MLNHIHYYKTYPKDTYGNMSPDGKQVPSGP
uniref:Uncharacterized protein n=1 Tax=Anguilla anguilla TaxID=7936 RepID=A0A0E9SY69_ANGAN